MSMPSNVSLAGSFCRVASLNSRSRVTTRTLLPDLGLRRRKLENDIFQPADTGVELPYDVNDTHRYLALNGTQADPRALVYRPAAFEPGRR